MIFFSMAVKTDLKPITWKSSSIITGKADSLDKWQIEENIPPLPLPPLVQSASDRTPQAFPGCYTLHPDACKRSCTAAGDPHLELQGQAPKENVKKILVFFLHQEFGRTGILDTLTCNRKTVSRENQTGRISECAFLRYLVSYDCGCWSCPWQAWFWSSIQTRKVCSLRLLPLAPLLPCWATDVESEKLLSERRQHWPLSAKEGHRSEQISSRLNSVSCASASAHLVVSYSSFSL